MLRWAQSHDLAFARMQAQFALLAPDLKLVVATSATAPPPAALPAQNAAVMALVGRLVQAAT
jgi:hypothetical protein